jgi:hypothetical protein
MIKSKTTDIFPNSPNGVNIALIRVPKNRAKRSFRDKKIGFSKTEQSEVLGM